MGFQTYKITLCGDGACGKSTLLKARLDQKFEEETPMTIGVDVACIPLEFSENSAVVAFDLGGQQQFQFIHDAYLKGIKLAVILYDLTRYQTFEHIPHWHQLLQQENSHVPIIVVGTKKDLVKEADLAAFQQDWEEMKSRLPNAQYFIVHSFISSKTREGVDELFNCIEKTLTEYYLDKRSRMRPML